MKNLLFYVVMVCILFIFNTPAYAYVEPGSGSMILQLLLGGLAGLAVLLKLFWHKLIGLFGLRKERNHDSGRNISDR